MTIEGPVRTLSQPPSEQAWAWALERDPRASLAVHVLSTPVAPRQAPPRVDELILWFAVPGPADASALLENLSGEEAARASRFQFPADRWSFAAAHAGLRLLLGPMVACAPKVLQFTTGPNGKPMLDRHRHGADIHFSISHTRGCVAVAIAGCPVGVDVEQRRHLPDFMALARAAFAPESRHALAACTGAQARQSLFLRYWTLGEAFIKATGEGVSQGLSSFAFTAHETPRLVRVDGRWGPPDRWRFDCGP